MMAIILNADPSECEKIVSGDKTMVTRIFFPWVIPPFKCYIYCADSLQTVIGEFVCDQIYHVYDIVSHSETLSYVACDEFDWHISNLNIYKEPRDLNYLTSLSPHNWSYLSIQE